MNNEQAEKNKAISKYVEKSILRIRADCNDKTTGEHKAGTLGTGTLFKFLNKHFLITAAHVLAIAEKYEGHIGLQTGGQDKQDLTTKNCTIYFPSDDVAGNIYDIGIIKLSEELGKSLENNYVFLNEKTIQFKSNRNMNIYISGFPCRWGIFDKEKNIIFGKPFRLMTKYKIPSKEYIQYDSKVHILAEYSGIYYPDGDENKPVKAEQELRGISGCSMWSFEDKQGTIWTVEKCLKVIGIQSGVLQEEYIKGTKWVYIKEAFKHIDNNIYDLLQDCYHMQ